MAVASAYRKNLFLTRAVITVVLVIIAAACIIPLYLMFVAATRTNEEIFAGVSFVPGTAPYDNFINLVYGKIINFDTGARKEGLNIPQGFLNSTLIAISATGLSGYFSALTAFCFALYTFRLKNFLWGIIMAVIMVPPTVGLIGYFKLVSGLNMLDTYWPLILPAIANPFAVFFMRQYISSSLPLSLVEAARIDGAREMHIFHRIALPLAMPGLATTSILGFLGNWNSYLGPLIVLSNKSLFTMPLLIQQLNTSLFNRDFGAMYMAISLSVIPILIMFSIFSRQLIEGIAAGGVKE